MSLANNSNNGIPTGRVDAAQTILLGTLTIGAILPPLRLPREFFWELSYFQHAELLFSRARVDGKRGIALNRGASSIPSPFRSYP